MKKTNDAELIQNLVYCLNEYSKEHDTPPQRIKLSKFLKEYKQFSAYSFEKLGGFRTFVNAHFREEEQNLKVTQALRRHNSYVRGLERKVGDREAFHEKLVEDLSQKLREIKIQTTQLDPKETRKFLDALKVDSANKESRSVVSIWSDHHFGTNVNREEMGGKNEFNWIIGARRLGMLCEQLATYKIEKRNQHEELVVLLMGDNIGGVIHNQEGPSYELLQHQLAGATSYYHQALDYLRDFFPKIKVYCQAGNHGRSMHKASKDRVSQDKYDSYEHSIFNALSHIYAKDPKIEIIAPRSGFCDVLVQGHRIYATHGDTIFTVGNVGKVISIEKIEVEANKINAEELAKGRKPYEMFCSGHVHHPVLTQVGPGYAVAINGSLIGLDAYAHSIAKIHSSTAVQLVWEATKKYIQGDARKIFVDLADDKGRYEKIIKPYKGELTFPKLV